MDPFIVVVGVLLLVVATPIALIWWKLARKAAPYRDEHSGDGGSTSKKDDAEVIVLGAPGDSKRGS